MSIKLDAALNDLHNLEMATSRQGDLNWSRAVIRAIDELSGMVYSLHAEKQAGELKKEAPAQED